MMDRADAAWLAGLIDGEGCLASPRGNPRIRIKLSDWDVVLRAANLIDGTTHTEIVTNRKPLLIAQVTGERAVTALNAVLPYLGARRTTKATSIILAHKERQANPPRRIAGLSLVPQEQAA